ncbi:hypothetical protein EOL96_03645 [Candidatus Saccharibacteria bacterium]|nr:hypothetical protein [Candidatus Saccharibacteria bacterium]
MFVNWKNHVISLMMAIVIFAVGRQFHSVFADPDTITLWRAFDLDMTETLARYTHPAVDFIVTWAMLYLVCLFFDGPLHGMTPHRGRARFVWQIAHPTSLMFGGMAGAICAAAFGWAAGLVLGLGAMLLMGCISALFGLAVSSIDKSWMRT